MRVLQPSDLRCPVSGKHAYPTEARAREQLQVVWQRPSPGRHPHSRAWRVYECPECGWWHLGGQLTHTTEGVPDGY
jgi:hypothetical protein